MGQLGLEKYNMYYGQEICICRVDKGIMFRSGGIRKT